MVKRTDSPEEEYLSPRPYAAPEGMGFADRVPIFLIEWTPFRRSLSNGLQSLLEPTPPPQPLLFPPAPFWPDVLVREWFPWLAFARSYVGHAIFILLFVGIGHLIFGHRTSLLRPTDDLSHYELSPYLPPIRSMGAPAARRRPGHPAHSPQAIVSAPPDADNTVQTVVMPSGLRTTRNIPLPNIVAWDPVPPPPDLHTIGTSRRVTTPPDLIIAPPPELTAARTSRTAPPSLSTVPIPPPPEIKELAQRAKLTLPADIVAPPPEPRQVTARRPQQLAVPAAVPPPPDIPKTAKSSTVNLAPTLTVANPKLAVQPQQAAAANASADPSTKPSASSRSTAAAQPPPSSSPSGATPSSGAPPPASQSLGTPLIALNLHPADAATGAIPAGNRRGTFATTPEGKAGAAGTPDIKPSQNGKDAGASTRGKGSSGAGDTSASTSASLALPPGIAVSAAPAGSAIAPVGGTSTTRPMAVRPSSFPDFKSLTPSVRQTMAAASLPPPRVDTKTSSETSETKLSPIERHIFGVRRTYTLAVNSPNLNSAGGSWVIHFAELKGEASPGRVVAPEVIEKIDPKYPAELQRRHYEGTVTLYAVIHSDGRVSDVRVVEGIGGELDDYARTALERWRFRPATKDGVAVALEALVSIPFKARDKF